METSTILAIAVPVAYFVFIIVFAFVAVWRKEKKDIKDPNYRLKAFAAEDRRRQDEPRY